MDINEIPSSLKLNSRIQYKKAVGTVRFIGTLNNKSSSNDQQQQDNNNNNNNNDTRNKIWLGIEWDDVTRGKHSGSYNGIHYFRTAVPNSGTFVNLSKLLGVTPKATGVSLYHAIKLRFADAIDISHRTRPAYVHGKAFDFDEFHQVNIQELQVVDVSGMCVSHVKTNDDEIVKMLNLKELYLCRSLFTNMIQVMDILNEFGKTLRLLDLSRNVLSFDYDVDVEKEKVFQNCTTLECLILNHCVLNNGKWNGVLWICKHVVTCLKELRLHNCHLTSILSTSSFLTKDKDVHFFLKDLQVLDLDENHISWDDVKLLSTLPNLCELYISANQLTDTQQFSCSNNNNDDILCFPTLRILSVERNHLNGWKFLTWLHYIPTLRHVRACGNRQLMTKPTRNTTTTCMIDSTMNSTSPSPDFYYRMKVIGRLGQIMKLDGSDISEDERIQAERMYLRDEILPSLDENINQQQQQQQQQQQHPRYKQLMTIYADSISNSMSNLNNKMNQKNNIHVMSMRAHAIPVTLRLIKNHHSQYSSDHRMQVTRILPGTTQGDRIKVIMRTLLRISKRENMDVNLNINVVEMDGRNRKIDLTDDMTIGSVVGQTFESVLIQCEL